MEKKFAIVTDFGCALTAPLRSRFRIDAVVEGNIAFPDGRTIKSDLDWKTMTPDEYFASFKDKKFVVKTSCPNVDEIEAMFLPFAKEGRDILMVTISHGLSGTYNFALAAATEITKQYPDVHIHVVDSLRYSTAQSLLLVHASFLREEGKCCDEVAAWLEENKSRFHQIGIMDDLFYLARSGRLNKVAAFMGTLAGVEPMADFSSNGLCSVIGKGKGKKKSLDAAVSYLLKLAINPKDQIIFVAHSLREQEALYLKKAIEDRVGPKEVILSSVDMMCGANIGPGLVACFFFGEEISEDLSKEKQTLAACLQGK